MGFNPPAFGHMSLILAPDKSKLSKRHGATSVGDFKAQVRTAAAEAEAAAAAAERAGIVLCIFYSLLVRIGVEGPDSIYVKCRLVCKVARTNSILHMH